MTTPREEDRAAELARQLNQAGIKADPGVLGGVVIYATAGQAETFLASLVPADSPRGSAQQQLLWLIELLGKYAEAKFGDEWWPGNASAWIGPVLGQELTEMLDFAEDLRQGQP